MIREESQAMKQRLPVYPHNKDSGVTWLSQIPVDWESCRVKWVFRSVNGSTPKSSTPDYWDGDIPWVTPEDLGKLESDTIPKTRRLITKKGYESCGTTLVPQGSLVLSTRAPIGHIGIAGVPLCTNQGCRALVFKRQGRNRFFYYQFLALRSPLESYGQGSTFMELGKSKLDSFMIARPPIEDQGYIVRFLDRETAKIDEMIAKKERLIVLLEEKRTALISRAVTEGLDSSAPMKDSGLSWLGAVPSHWEIKRLKYQSPQVTVGIVVTPARYYVDEGIPCLRSFNVSQRGLTDSDLVFISKASNELHAKSMIFTGDLVVVRTGQPGTTAVVDERFHGTNCIDLIIVRKSRKFNSAFLAYLANSWFAKVQFETGAGGAIQQHFNIEIAKNLLVLCPPISEQAAIVEYLDGQSRRLDDIIRLNRSLVEKLREYRTALISAAVTGKIDVRNELVKRSGLSKRLIEAAEHLFLKKDPEAALTPLCNAIDKVSADVCGGSGRQVYKQFIHERMELITRIPFGGLAIMNMNFAIPSLHDERGKLIESHTTDPEGNRLYSFEQIIYHLVRCKLSHECEVAPFIRDSGPGSGQIKHAGDALYFPFDAIAMGLLFAILAEVDLRQELVGSIFEKAKWKGVALIDLVGRKERMLELSKTSTEG